MITANVTEISDLPIADRQPLLHPRPPRTAWLVLIPAAVCLYFIVKSIGLLVATPWPLNPWESIIFMDAWRTTQGINVYRFPDEAPATHMYGPLVTYLNALVFLVTGPNFHTPRVVALVSTVMLTVGFALAFARRAGFVVMVVSSVIVLAQFYRTRASFTESRPDAIAALFMFVSLCMLYRGQRTGRLLWTITGSLCVVIGFFFKQTAAAVAVVPLVVVLLERPSPFARRSLEALLPPVLMLATLLALRLFWPEAYFYMIRVPREFELRPAQWHLHFLNIFTFNLLFVAAIVAYLRDRGTQIQNHRDEQSKLRWILATCAVTAISCTLAVAKRGGGMNSYLPVFLAMSAFIILTLPRLLHMFEARGSLAGRIAGTLVLGLLLAADMVAVPNTLVFTTRGVSHGDPNYFKVVDRVRALPGMVISPDDPAIVFLATGYAGRALHAELDSTGNRRITDGLRRDMEQAKWLIRVHATWEFHPPRWDPPSLGYRLVNDPFMNRVKRYSLWVREQ